MLDLFDMIAPYLGIVFLGACLISLIFVGFKYRESLTKSLLQTVWKLIKRKR